MGNCFRMFLRSLLVSLGQTIADPPSEEESGNYLDQDVVPAEARTSGVRRRHVDRRRKADPLGGGTLVSGGCG